MPVQARVIFYTVLRFMAQLHGQVQKKQAEWLHFSDLSFPIQQTG
jgi:hypothetical protein